MTIVIAKAVTDLNHDPHHIAQPGEPLLLHSHERPAALKSASKQKFKITMFVNRQTNRQTNAPTVASTPKRAPAAAAVFCTTGNLPSQHLLTLLLLLTYNNNNNSIEGLRTTFSKKLQGAMLVWNGNKIADRDGDPSKVLPLNMMKSLK